jgi:hypothetical protein
MRCDRLAPSHGRSSAEDRLEGVHSMEPGGNGITFEEADRRYAELKRQHEAGALSDEVFAARLRELMVQDDEDRWWAKSLRTGEWHRWDGERYVKDTPPYERPQRVETPPPGGTTVRGGDLPRPQAEQERPPSIEAQPPEQTVRPDGAPVGVEDEGRRGVSRKLVVGGCLVVAVLAVVGLLAIVAALRTGGPTAPDVVGQTESEARRNVGNDYNIYVSEVRVADEPKGTIISQNPNAGEAAKPGSTISVVVSAGKPPKPGDIFKDDFSDTSSGWDVNEGTGSNPWTTGYALGGYRIYNPPPGGSLIGLNQDAGSAIGDAIIEVDATPITGDVPEDESLGWGIICRALDYDNNYYLAIYVGGQPAIYRQQNGEWTELATGTPSDAFRGGNATNHLRADCVGSNLTLYVNGQKVIEAQDSEFKTGQVGLITESTDKHGAEILFDNFSVSSP